MALSLEIVGILGALFAFLVYGVVRTVLAKREAGERRRAEQIGPLNGEKGRLPPGSK